MNATELQQWLNAHGATLVADGQCGPLTREAIRTVFANDCAPAIDDAGIEVIAASLGCSAKQVRAVASVESSGSGYDKAGRPKILFERHKFHQLTDGKYGLSVYSNPQAGGYAFDSWEKLTLAACKDADAAFMATSWGKFQVLGMHWAALGYPSPIDMAYSTVTSEAAHYDMLARYVEHNHLKPALQALSTNPETCRAFAAAYNGAAYRKFNYHVKLAEAMR
jgi:hypothetical protein